MARRATPGKSRPVTAASPAPASAPTASKKSKGTSESPRSLQQRIDELERELAEARAHIGELQNRQTEIADRIAWALDSLHELMEEGS